MTKKIINILLLSALVFSFSCSVDSPPEQIKKHIDFAIPVFNHKFNMKNYEGIFNSLVVVGGVKEIPAGVVLDDSKLPDFNKSYNFFVADLYEDNNYIETLTPKYYIVHNLPEGIDIYVDAYVMVNGQEDHFWFGNDGWHKLETTSTKEGNKIVEFNKVTLTRKRMESLKNSDKIFFNVKMETTRGVKIDELVKSSIDISVGMRASVYMEIEL